MESWRDFQGVNAGYVLELYERFQHDPQAVDTATRDLFSQWSPAEIANGGRFANASIDVVVGAMNLAQAIRGFGHLAAQTDPLGSQPTGDPDLAWAAHQITEKDLRELPAELVGGPIGLQATHALDAIQQLREVYTTHIGYDFDHIRIPEERQWLREAAESRRYHRAAKPDYARALLERLTQVEVFEQFLQQTFPTKYRFSLEGLDMLVPMLDELIVSSAETGIAHVLMGMAHRGRLNVLAHIFNKPHEQILAEFKDPLRIQEIQNAIGWTTGDVKYHKGIRRVIKAERANGALVLSMPPNPSHLELVNPVLMGMARAAGTSVDAAGLAHFDPKLTLQILLHGDAAFPAQGIVAETLNLSQLRGYWVGGTIHIITNNQIGFTTLPEDARSTLYASDLAKGYKIPIVHVNADQPEACIEVIRIAYAYQEKFEKDFLIDLIGYRRYGHNELDEPAFTQPLMYQSIREHPSVRKLWANTLIERDILDVDAAEKYVGDYQKKLQKIYDSLDEERLAEPQPKAPSKGAARRVKTAVTAGRLKAINAALKIPQEFNFYPQKLEAALQSRRDALEKTDTIDWATAEELAFATILEDGIAIRLTGQDSERGTFSQRHAVLHDAKTGSTYIPLQAFPQAKAAFEIYNSPLSEAAAVGFEYGYNLQEAAHLVIWEAQYGDFINSAQGVIDEYLTAAREKWGQIPSLTLLLPHAWEGAGPDHSSARLERWLQLAANTNTRIANCSTSAQYFHLLRRQALLLKTDPLPLVILTPKSLLRNPASFSSLKDLAHAKWQPLIDDPQADPKTIRRLVFCSGKLFFDLASSEFRDKYSQVALARVEQLYPFPSQNLARVIERYPHLQEIVWAQEEPKNMGAWEFMSWRLERLIDKRLPVNYVGRRRSPSPAEGSLTAHKTNQTQIVEYAFRWKFKHDT